jgi:hypothetical protein
MSLGSPAAAEFPALAPEGVEPPAAGDGPGEADDPS